MAMAAGLEKFAAFKEDGWSLAQIVLPLDIVAEKFNEIGWSVGAQQADKFLHMYAAEHPVEYYTPLWNASVTVYTIL